MGRQRVRRRSAVHRLCAAACAAALAAPHARGQATAPATQPAPATAPAAGDEALVGLNLPENVPLKVLIDYVSQEFNLNILYDEQAANQRVTIKAPAKLPKSAVPALLESALRMRGFALIDGDRPGWRRVVPLVQAARVPDAAGGTGGAAIQPGDVLTQVFKLQYADATKADTLVKPFLTVTGASSFPLAEQGLLVVTDFAGNLRRVADLVRAVDQPTQEVAIEFIPVKHADPSRLTQQVEQLLKAKVRAQGGGDRLAAAVEATYDGRTNQVVVIAPKERLEDARAIVASLDATVTAEQSPVRFYKLANTTAADTLATIRSLEGESDDAGGSGGTGIGGSGGAPGRIGAPSGRSPRGTSGRTDATSAGAGGAARAQPYNSGGITAGTSAAPAAAASGALTVGSTPAGAPPAGGAARSPLGAVTGAAGDASPQVRDALRTKQARVTADPHTNSIIVVGPPDVQRLYEQLIKSLDKRRPQVLVEVTIVTLDTSNNFSLGVDIGRAGGFDRNGVVTFSSFGLSTPNPQTGRLTLLPGAGFNGALVSSDIADVVVRALQQDNHARVSSAPRILVNDNNVGTLNSISEFPYASVNASNTVATTSFGDYAQAGTEITVTPHISESDYLQLEYAVSLSSFTGDPISQGGTVLPPARKSDTVQSQVTIPDGATIVVGGLNQRNFTDNVNSVPLLGQIPVLRYLFSSRTKNESKSTLFVFIRPVILRDDKFADLRFLSEQDVRTAGVPADLPASEPMTVR